jgi:hypothetical protein
MFSIFVLEVRERVFVAIRQMNISKTGRHGIAEILLKVALSTINQLNQTKDFYCWYLLLLH